MEKLCEKCFWTNIWIYWPGDFTRKTMEAAAGGWQEIEGTHGGTACANCEVQNHLRTRQRRRQKLSRFSCMKDNWFFVWNGSTFCHTKIVFASEEGWKERHILIAGVHPGVGGQRVYAQIFYRAHAQTSKNVLKMFVQFLCSLYCKQSKKVFNPILIEGS